MVEVCYFVIFAIALWCSVSDIAQRRIPNAAILILVGIAAVLSLLTGVWVNLPSLLVAVALGLGLYLLRCFGAGDIKYFWACMLVVPEQTEPLLLATAVSGLILAIVYLAKHKFRPKEVGTLPYGVAISAGLVLCLLLRAVL